MNSWLIALAAGIVAALLQYARLIAPTGVTRAALGVLRAGAVALTVALLLDAPAGPMRPMPPSVFVDRSLSMTRNGTSLWNAAWDSAAAAQGDTIWAFGDTVMPGRRSLQPDANATLARPVVERAMASGRPAVLITDGEVQDSSALDGLVSGSRIVVLAREPRADVAVIALDAPRAVIDGDSVRLRIMLSAGALGMASGSVTARLNDAVLGRWPFDAMSPWAERQIDAGVRMAGAPGSAVLSIAVSGPADAEPRNDTLGVAITLSRAAGAVFVSTSPDQDARFAMAVLRGALALPTRGFLRVAPGAWRREGTLAATTELEVRQALRDAPVAIIHGDTSIFGPPRSATLGPLALIAPPDADGGEWYASAAPPSPLSGALAGTPFDSLPPVVAGTPARGDWVGLEARRGREEVRRPVVTGTDSPRRAVTVTGSGFWRWRFRGGASADTYAALWGGIFDWLAAERADRRGALPDESIVRAGQAIRWRRGSALDSVVRVALRRRGAPRADSLTLRFAPGVSLQESPSLPPGVYDVTVPHGAAVLVVNTAAELLPARPRLQSGAVGRRQPSDPAGGVRRQGWLYALVILLLCAEWVARRRVGLR